MHLNLKFFHAHLSDGVSDCEECGYCCWCFWSRIYAKQVEREQILSSFNSKIVHRHSAHNIMMHKITYQVIKNTLLIYYYLHGDDDDDDDATHYQLHL